MGYVRYSQSEKRRLVREWESSDESLAEFSRAHRVSAGSLTRWGEELGNDGESGRNGGSALKFVELGVVGQSTSEPGTPKVAAELVLPGGVILRVFNPVSAC